MPDHIFDEDRRRTEIQKDTVPDDLQFDWSSDMEQISGFAGDTVKLGDMTLYGSDYENDCRRMVEYAVDRMVWEYGSPPPDLDPTHEAAVQYIVGANYNGDEQAFRDEILQIIANGSKYGATGAMVAACYAHAMLIWQFGWKVYKNSMKRYKDHPDMEGVYELIEKLYADEFK